MTEYEKMLKGVLYDPSDDYLSRLRRAARKAANRYNRTDEDEGATRREILEETGVQVKMQGKFRESVAYDIGTIIHKTVVYFLCEIVGEPEVTIQEEEISDYAFFGPDEVPGHLTYSNDKHTFAKALRYIKSRNLA